MRAIGDDERIVTGWGRTSPVRSRVVELHDPTVDELRHALDAVDDGSRRRGTLARGLGRSYGDAAQVAGGTALRLVDDPARCVLDPATGTLTAPAGVSFDDVVGRVVPAGWFVPVTPGTRHVTVGGAVACDVHGKNHHVDGSIGAHVRSIDLLTADGELRHLRPDDPATSALFRATIGGMGLTGVVRSVELAMIPVETSSVRVTTRRCVDLDDTMATIAEHESRHRYTVAWVDLLAGGGARGRGVVTSGDHASVADVEAAGSVVGPTAARTRPLASVPAWCPDVLRPSAVRAFAEAWFRRAPVRRDDELQGLGRFFHPLDGVGGWNHLYGRRGFVQYQFVVPLGAEAALRRVVESAAAAGAPSFLTVLKRFGPGFDAPLSFPRPGWTLTMDLPAKLDGLGRLLNRLDDVVLSAGGRHYLAKDGCLTPEAVRRGYPRLGEWRSVRDAVDPERRWVSDLARRLHLVDDPSVATVEV